MMGMRCSDGQGFARCMWVSRHREELNQIGVQIANGLDHKVDWVPDCDGLRAEITQNVFVRIGCHSVPKEKRFAPAIVIEDFDSWSGHGIGNRVVGKFRVKNDGDLPRGIEWVKSKTRSIVAERKRIIDSHANMEASKVGSFARAKFLVEHELRSVPRDSYKISQNPNDTTVGYQEGNEKGTMAMVRPVFDGREYHANKIRIDLQEGVGREVSLGRTYKESMFFRPVVARRILRLLNQIKKIADEEAVRLEAKAKNA